MSDFEVSYEDGKQQQINIECRSLFGDLAKKLDDVLDINLLQVYVEVPLESKLSDEKKMIAAIKKRAESAGNEVRKDVEDLAASLRKLQKEEEHGNKKAASEGEKLVKATEKTVKKWAGDLGGALRKAVQEAVGSRANLRSVSRTIFRGMELSEDAFDGSAEEAETPGYVVDLAKALAAAGKEVFKLTTQEKEQRKELALKIEKVQQLADKASAGKNDFDIKEFYKTNAEHTRPLEVAALKYVDFLAELGAKLEETQEKYAKLDNLIEKNEKLDSNKAVNEEFDEYGKSKRIVTDSLKDKTQCAARAKRLFKEDYKSAEWRGLASELAALKGAAKSGKLMQDCGSALEKKLKG